MDLTFNTLMQVDNDEFDFGITDLQIVEGPGGDVTLVGLARVDGGLFAWELFANSTPQLRSVRGQDTDLITASGPHLALAEWGGNIGVIAAGCESNTVQLSALNGHGGIKPLTDVTTSVSAWNVVTQLDSGQVVLAADQGSGFALFDMAEDGLLSAGASVSDTPLIHTTGIVEMAATTLDGQDLLLVASAPEQGLSAFAVDGNQITETSSYGAASGLGLMTPTSLEIVTAGTQQFAVLATAAGQSGALSVFRLDYAGALTPVDHALDTLNTRFGSVQDIAVAAYGDVGLVVAGGGDDGLSLMTLLPNGRLVHMDAFADDLQTGLTGVTSIELKIFDSTAHIFAASGADAGLTHMTVDLSGLGDTHLAGTGGTIIGGTGDDIFVAGDGIDVFDGNDGADTFVMSTTGSGTDEIRNFNPNEDILDLSDWPFLYDVNALTITTTSQGATLSHRGTTLELRGPANTPLNIEAVRAAVDLDLNRSPVASQITATGTDGENTLFGGWGSDTLSGLDGNDDLSGGAGHDVIDGGRGKDRLMGENGADVLDGGRGNDELLPGMGNDHVTGGDGFDTGVFMCASSDVEILAYDASTASVTFLSAEGIDTFEHVEDFSFTDILMSFEDLDPNKGPDELDGSTGADHLIGGTGINTLRGFAGNDTLSGLDGADMLKGGKGDDTLNGGRGADNLKGAQDDDVLSGEQGKDRLWGGSGRDQLFGDLGDDQLYGEEGADALFGGGGHDILFGHQSADSLSGGAGNDEVRGGAGADTLYGDGGKDEIRGGGGADVLSGGNGDDLLVGGRGDDLFIFEANMGIDVILGFDPNEDSLQIAAGLVDHATEGADVVDQFAELSSGSVTFTFSGTEILVLDGITDVSDLSDAIFIL